MSEHKKSIDKLKDIADGVEKAGKSSVHEKGKAENIAKAEKQGSKSTYSKGKNEEKGIDPKQQQIEDLTDTLQRLQAEFENYRKRAAKDNDFCTKFAAAGLVQKLLTVLDSIDQAEKNSKDTDKFIKGTEMIFSQLKTILAAEGLRPISAVGEKFDPFRHEVLLKEASDKDEDIVLEELQKGYMFKDKVLRHSKVKVSKKDDNKKPEPK